MILNTKNLLADGDYVIIDDNFVPLSDYLLDEIIVDDEEYTVVSVESQEIIATFTIQKVE